MQPRIGLLMALNAHMLRNYIVIAIIIVNVSLHISTTVITLFSLSLNSIGKLSWSVNNYT